MRFYQCENTFAILMEGKMALHMTFLFIDFSKYHQNVSFLFMYENRINYYLFSEIEMKRINKNHQKWKQTTKNVVKTNVSVCTVKAYLVDTLNHSSSFYLLQCDTQQCRLLLKIYLRVSLRTGLLYVVHALETWIETMLVYTSKQ